MHQNNPNVTIYESRSYGGEGTNSDHKLVMANYIFERKYSNTPKHRSGITYEILYGKDKSK